MKKCLAGSILLLSFLHSYSQVMQASIGLGSAATRVIVYVKPTAAVSGTISTLQFDVAIDAAVTPVPAVSIVGTPAFGITWNIDPPYIEGAYRHYQFTTSASPTVTIAAGAETAVMEIAFTGGPSTLNNVYLQSFGYDNSNGYPGGNSGNIIFFCSGAANSVEGQLFYARPGTTVINNNSYTGPLPSSATLGGILLPVHWLAFNATRQNNAALLNWQVTNEGGTKNYEVQRSTDGSTFQAIGTLPALNSGSYAYTDTGFRYAGAKVVYYRIKETGNDGRTSFSDTRLLKNEDGLPGISLFPNPAQHGFYVTAPGITGDRITMQLIDATGKLVSTRAFAVQQGSDYYYPLNNGTIAAGNYTLRILSGNTIAGVKQLYISK